MKVAYPLYAVCLELIGLAKIGMFTPKADILLTKAVLRVSRLDLSDYPKILQERYGFARARFGELEVQLD